MKKFTLTNLIILIALTLSYAQSNNNFLIVSSHQPVSQEVETYLNKEQTFDEYESIAIDLRVLVNNRINLSFLNQVISLEKTKMDIRSSNDFSWFGSNNEKLYQAILTVKEKDIQGVIFIENTLYQILTINDTYIISKVDQSKFKPEGCVQNRKHKELDINDTIIENFKTKELEKPIPTIEGNIRYKTHPQQEFWNFECKLRVLVLYTTASKNAISNIENHIRLAMDETNQSFVNSGINYRAELVHMEETSYTETGDDIDDLENFTLTNGHMDKVHNLRETYSADVCVLIAELTQFCGFAAAIKSCQDRSFCIVDRSCAVTNLTFAHEIGQLIGARHDHISDPENTPYAYGHGFIQPTGSSYRTIMGLSSHTRIPWWSNPDKLRNGLPMGTQSTNNNTRVLNEYIPNVMSHRPLTGTRLVSQSDINSSVGVIYHSNRIETSGNVNIPMGFSWGFIAGAEVRLNDGFETEVGSTFEAKIHPTCGISDNEQCNFNTSFDKKTDIVENYILDYYVFPNPVMSNYFSINYMGNESDDVEFEILNVFGQKIKSKDQVIFNNKYYISEYPPGIYFVRLYDANEVVKTIKIIKL